MILEHLDVGNTEDVDFLEKVFLNSFPRKERRPIDVLFHLYKTNPHFTIDIAKFEEKTVGFLCYWDLDTFIYGEYFAIAPNFRNGGYGKVVFQEFINSIQKPIIIEVELPETDLATRRIGFYQRLGFTAWEKIQYKQPPYYKGGPYVPLMLMSKGDIDVEKDIYKIVDTLYSAVYDVKK